METSKRALLVGIDDYQNLPKLTGCVADAVALRTLLQRHEDGSPNYDCRVVTSADQAPITREVLRSQWHALFDDFDGHILFHFSGHGAPTRTGGVLVTHDGTPRDPGLPMDELTTLANRSKAKTLVLIIDCCHAGIAGDPAILCGNGDGAGEAVLREGVTILAATRESESARELGGHGVFTRLIMGALNGGAADVRGRVSVASIYAYVEQALGSWDQRPMYKSFADYLPPVRLCRPLVPDSLLRELPKLFATDTAALHLAPSFERTHESARSRHVAIFNQLKILRNANLLTSQAGKDLFFIALESGWVKLTPLGQFYRGLAERNLI